MANKNKHCDKNKKGSMLVAVLIVMIMLMAIILALVNRSVLGHKIIQTSKQSYSAYQNADSRVEALLNTIRSFDLTSNGSIPENTNAVTSGICVGGVVCQKCTSPSSCSDIDPANDHVSDISMVSDIGTTNDINRRVEVPVMKRVDRVNGVSVKKCGDPAAVSDCTWNKCDVKVSWTKPSTLTNADGSDKISGYEIRRSTQSSLNTPVNDTPFDYGWRNVNPLIPSTSPDINDIDSTWAIIKNHSDSPFFSSQYGHDYWFTVKAKNVNNFELDSLYYPTAARVTLDSSSSCSSSPTHPDVLDGCKQVAPAGTHKLEDTYNCCNGTECYEINAGWIPSDDDECAIEQCESSDNVEIYPSGDSNSGYCTTANNSGNCVQPPTNQCDDVYVTQSYCTSCPSGWDFSNNSIVDYDDNLTKPRCCRQSCDSWTKPSCPADPANGHYVNNSTCTENTCGSRTEITSCTLVCDDPANYVVNGASCIPRNKTWTCPAIPDSNGTWNTVSSYNQTWNGSAYVPANDATTEYNTTASTTSCRYKCKTGAVYLLGRCIML